VAQKTLTPRELNRIRQAELATMPDDIQHDSSILRLLTTSDRQQIAKLILEKKYNTGDVIFKEGDIGQSMSIVRTGRVAVVKGGFDNPTVLGLRGPGEVIGEMALLEDRPRSASIVAMGKVSLLEISRENFQIILNNNTELRLKILSTLSARLRAADEARRTGMHTKKALAQKLTHLESEKEYLLEQNQLRQETSDLIIHDLRNPLGLVAGTINLLELTLPSEVIEQYADLLDIVNSNLDRMHRLVDSLLGVANMEPGTIHLSRADVSPALLINQTVNQLKPMLTNYEITIEVNLPDTLPTVKIDEEIIGRVLANLLDNAFKYTPSGGTVAVSACQNEQQILISVANPGPTIPPEDRERVFERFTRVSGGKPAVRGFGLGLAFCRLAVDAHGGKIWVEPLDRGGEGNRFVFSLPL